MPNRFILLSGIVASLLLSTCLGAIIRGTGRMTLDRRSGPDSLLYPRADHHLFDYGSEISHAPVPVTMDRLTADRLLKGMTYKTSWGVSAEKEDGTHVLLTNADEWHVVYLGPNEIPYKFMLMHDGVPEGICSFPGDLVGRDYSFIPVTIDERAEFSYDTVCYPFSVQDLNVLACFANPASQAPPGGGGNGQWPDQTQVEGPHIGSPPGGKVRSIDQAKSSEVGSRKGAKRLSKKRKLEENVIGSSEQEPDISISSEVTKPSERSRRPRRRQEVGTSVSLEIDKLVKGLVYKSQCQFSVKRPDGTEISLGGHHWRNFASLGPDAIPHNLLWMQLKSSRSEGLGLESLRGVHFHASEYSFVRVDKVDSDATFFCRESYEFDENEIKELVRFANPNSQATPGGEGSRTSEKLAGELTEDQLDPGEPYYTTYVSQAMGENGIYQDMSAGKRLVVLLDRKGDDHQFVLARTKSNAGDSKTPLFLINGPSRGGRGMVYTPVRMHRNARFKHSGHKAVDIQSIVDQINPNLTQLR